MGLNCLGSRFRRKLPPGVPVSAGPSYSARYHRPVSTISFATSTMSAEGKPQPTGQGAITWMKRVPLISRARSTFLMKSFRYPTEAVAA